MVDLISARRLPLADVPPLAATALSMAPLLPQARFVLRARPAAQAAIGQALGVALPTLVCRANVAGNRAALWLGPDEWLVLLLLPDGGAETLPAAFAVAAEGAPYSLVDISHRQSGLSLSGPQAATVLNTGCALDLDLAAFPVGMCTRTLLGKADITLWRTSETTFHIEAWRSFLPYVWQFLQEAAREFLV